MKKLLLLSIISISLFSCVKSGGVIPDVAVNIQIVRTDPRASNLIPVGGAIEVQGGVAGIIIYHETDNTFASYDRCSTVNPTAHNAVNLDQGNFTATDPVSGAKFSMIDGTPVKAPATVALRSYSTTWDANNIYITN